MRCLTRTSAWLLSFALLAIAAGCTKPEEKMKTGPEDKGCADQLKACQTQLDECNNALTASQNEAQACKTERDRLREQLAGQTSPAGGWEGVPGGAMTSIEGTALFDSGSATIKVGGKKALDAAARVLKEKFAGYEVYVFGHTDNEPIKRSKWKDNYELSCQRALSVVRYLGGQGVTHSYMATCGWGEHRPAVKSSGREQANRRVQIFAMVPQKGAAGPATPPAKPPALQPR